MQRSLFLFSLVAVLAAPAWSDGVVTPAVSAPEPLIRLQQQVERAERERREALVDAEDMARRLDEAQTAIGTAEQAVAAEKLAHESAERRAAELAAERSRLQGLLDDARRELERQKGALALANGELGKSRSARQLMEGELVERDQRLQQCAMRNDKLVALAQELMVKYRDKSCLDALKQSQPFSGLKKMEIENLLEGWNKQLDEQRMEAPGPGKEAPAPEGAPPPAVDPRPGGDGGSDNARSRGARVHGARRGGTRAYWGREPANAAEESVEAEAPQSDATKVVGPEPETPKVEPLSVPEVPQPSTWSEEGDL